MVDKICNYLLKKIRNKMPEVDDERAEVINYGLQILIGEIPKFFIIILISYVLGVLELTLLTLLLIIPYRTVAGGTHLKTHIGCLICTTLFYTGTAFLSKSIIIPFNIKIISTLVIWIFSIFMIKLYAPADTEDVPILRKKERKIKKILSYIIATINLSLVLIIKNEIISNILLFGTLIETIFITRIIYKLTNNKYGYEEYCKNTIIKEMI